MRCLGLVSAAFASLLLAGCQTGSSPSSSAAPPPGATVWKASAPPPGSRFEFEREQDGEASTYAFEVTAVEEDPLTGNPLIVGTNFTHEFAVDAQTGRTVRWDRIVDGEDNGTVSNDTGWLDAPLWVGKSWTQTLDFRDKARGRSWRGIQTFWTAVGTETLTTPAGTFETVVLEGRPGRNSATTYRTWYAPDLGVRVKRESVRSGNHYRGPGGTVRTLISMELPEDTAADEAS